MSLLGELFRDEGVIQLGLPSLDDKTVFFGPCINILLMLRKKQGAEVLVVLLVVPISDGYFCFWAILTA